MRKIDINGREWCASRQLCHGSVFQACLRIWKSQWGTEREREREKREKEMAVFLVLLTFWSRHQETKNHTTYMYKIAYLKNLGVDRELEGLSIKAQAYCRKKRRARDSESFLSLWTIRIFLALSFEFSWLFSQKELWLNSDILRYIYRKMRSDKWEQTVFIILFLPLMRKWNFTIVNSIFFTWTILNHCEWNWNAIAEANLYNSFSNSSGVFWLWWIASLRINWA